MCEVGEAIRGLTYSALLACALSACGLKTDLVVYDDVPMPTITHVSHQVRGDVLQLRVDIQGGSGAVSYQIDRAQVQPDCQCVSGWFRYYASSPSNRRQGLAHNIRLRHKDKVYAFRVRAKDSLGRVSAWSKILKVKAEHE